MDLLFVEAAPFSAERDDYLPPEQFREVQNALMAEPRKGDVVPETGGIRKLRVPHAVRGKGKRGGCRLMYLYLPEANEIHFLAIYSKDEKIDLTASDKKAMKQVVNEIRTTALLRETLRRKQE